MDFAGFLFFLAAITVFPGLTTIGLCGFLVCKLVWRVHPRHLTINQVAAMLFASAAATTSPITGNIGLETPPQSSIAGHIAMAILALMVATMLVAKPGPRWGLPVASAVTLASWFTLSATAGNSSTVVIATFPGLSLARWVIAIGSVILVASVAGRNLGSACVIAATSLVVIGIAGASLGSGVAGLALAGAVAASAWLAGASVSRERFWIVSMFGLVGVGSLVIGTM
jgi:hypothetical protein